MANKVSIKQHAQTLGITKQAILKRVIKGLPIKGIKHYEKIGTNKKDIWVLYPLIND